MAVLKTYYCVTTRVYNDGRVVAVVSMNVKQYSCPKATFRKTETCDIYNDWFESYYDANYFVRETREMGKRK